jgi:hypothetical protein
MIGDIGQTSAIIVQRVVRQVVRQASPPTSTAPKANHVSAPKR